MPSADQACICARRGPETVIGRFPDFRGAELKIKVRCYVTRLYAQLLRELVECDKRRCGRIRVCLIRRAFERVCFPLSDEQWLELIEIFPSPNRELSYMSFLDRYRKNWKEDTVLWLKSHRKAEIKLPHNQEELLAVVKAQTRARRRALLADFLRLDYKSLGSVRPEDFRRIMTRHVGPMTDPQFEVLYKAAPKDVLGYVPYDNFLYYFGTCFPCPGFTDTTPPPRSLLLGPPVTMIPGKIRWPPISKVSCADP